MAVLHRKEEKIQAVLGRLSKKYSPDDFVAMFIKLYSKDWGKIKSAYIKASQDKDPGTVIHMPKPDLYLKQVLEIFLTQPNVIETKEAILPVITKEVKSKAPVKKIEKEEPIAVVKETQVSAKEKATKKASTKKVIIAEDAGEVSKKKVVATEKTIAKTAKSKVPLKKIEKVESAAIVKKLKAPAKKKAD